jgi:hypothetical protein
MTITKKKPRKKPAPSGRPSLAELVRELTPADASPLLMLLFSKELGELVGKAYQRGRQDLLDSLAPRKKRRSRR